MNASRPTRSLLCACLLTAGLWTGAPARAQEIDAATAAKIDAVFESFTKAPSPGCALGIYRSGDIAFARGYGLASLEHRVPITPATVFDLGSTSKQFTAFSILLLERDGKLSLDDDVRAHVTELPAYDRPVTIRHLVQHTSGLRDYLTLWSLAGMKTENWTTQDQAVRLVARQTRANFAAGDEWLYSNSGYLLLAEIVRRASGKTLGEFAAERIFAPLGMTKTFFLDDHTRVVENRATGYAPKEGGGFAVEMSNFEQVGDGAVQTTVEELARWDRNFYAPVVGDAALLARAQEPGRLNSGKDHGYAAGLTIGTYRGLPTVRHGGSWAGYRAELLRFPAQRTSIACLCNLASAGPSALAERVADIVLASSLASAAKPADAAAPAVALSAERMAALVGYYEHEKDGSFRRISMKDGALYYGLGANTPMTAVAQDRFRLAGSPVELVFPAAAPGAPQELRMVREGSDSAVFRRVPPAPSGGLDAYAGRFYSDELEAEWLLAVKGDGLTAQVLQDPPMNLVRVKADVFVAASGLVLRFERDAGAVRRVTVQAGRVTNLVFVRRD